MPASPTVPASPRLDYAPGAPLHRRRRVRRVTLLVLLLAFALAAWRYGPRLWSRGRLLYAQHRCLAYDPPADLVVYEGDTSLAAALLKQPAYAPIPVFTLAGGPKFSPPMVAAHRPPPLADLEAQIGGPLTGGPCAVLFMHEMRDSAGHRRLVIAFRDSNSTGPLFATFGIWTVVMDPATLLSDLRPTPKRNFKGWDYSGPGWELPGRNLRFYAGQIDPNDPSHFTIRYRMDGQEGVVDGRLNAAGDDVDITVRTGPAAPPSPWSSPLPPTFGDTTSQPPR